MLFGKRLRELRKQKGLTLESLAGRIGSSKGYLSGIENENVNPPTEKFVRKLARIFGQDEIEFLKLAYLDKVPRALQGELSKALGTEGRPGAVPSRQRPGEASGILPSRIPLLNTASQGYPNRISPNGFPEPLTQDTLRIPGVHPTHTFALTVCGDSMVSDEGPRFRHGEIALVSRAEHVRDGDFAFAIFVEKGREQGHLRQITLQEGDAITLQPLNRECPAVTLKRIDIHGLYKVVGKIEIFGGLPAAQPALKRDTERP